MTARTAVPRGAVFMPGHDNFKNTKARNIQRVPVTMAAGIHVGKSCMTRLSRLFFQALRGETLQNNNNLLELRLPLVDRLLHLAAGKRLGLLGQGHEVREHLLVFQLVLVCWHQLGQAPNRLFRNLFGDATWRKKSCGAARWGPTINNQGSHTMATI